MRWVLRTQIVSQVILGILGCVGSGAPRYSPLYFLQNLDYFRGALSLAYPVSKTWNFSVSGALSCVDLAQHCPVIFTFWAGKAIPVVTGIVSLKDTGPDTSLISFHVHSLLSGSCVGSRIL